MRSSLILFFLFTVAQARALDFEKLEQGVVKIEFSIYGIPIAHGSGFFINRQGMILTNRHVMMPYFEGLPTTTITVRTRAGKSFVGDQVKLYGCADNPQLDACLLQVTTLPDYVFAIRDEPMKKGLKVFEIGHPLGFDWTLSNGIVSGYQDVEFVKLVTPTPSAKKVHMLQTTSPTSPGNSGGPVFDENGKVAGMMTYTFGRDLGGQNLNFAVSAQELNTFVAERSKGKLFVLSELRKKINQEESEISEKKLKKVMEPGVITWVSANVKFGDKEYEMSVPKGACVPPNPKSNPSGLALVCLGMVVRFMVTSLTWPWVETLQPNSASPVVPGCFANTKA